MKNEQIIERLETLIKHGEQLTENQYSDYMNGELVLFVHKGPFLQWWTSSVTLLKIFSEQTIYLTEFEQHCSNHRHDCVSMGIGILKAAKEDLEKGLFQNIEKLVSVEVFSDFLDIADYLLENGYKDPTASLVGAVLEDGLRRICKNNGIDCKNREDISTLNSKLAAKAIYNRLNQKQIQVWNDIRNNADHGNFNEYNEQNVKIMIEGVRTFLSSYLN